MQKRVIGCLASLVVGLSWGAEPSTYIGNVMVRTDAQGRLAIILDEQKDTAPDGEADRVFLFHSGLAVDNVDVRLSPASILFRGDSLYVSSPTNPFVVDLAIAKPQDGRRDVVGARILLHDGVALQHTILASKQSLEAVRTDEWVTVASAESFSDGNCRGGGPGASSCSYKCGWPFNEECGVSCKDGYYACCGCDKMTQIPFCNCVMEQTYVSPRPNTPQPVK